ncbi:MAG TPA: hypothetical protein GXX47_09615 [Firmicutes bacterium]|nr:hypothetical protein [Bacillota bacterium]
MTLNILLPALVVFFVAGYVSSASPQTLHALAWEQQGRIKLAIGNTSSEAQMFLAGFGYYLMGPRILEEVAVEVPGKSILVTTYHMVRSDAQSGYRAADMVFITAADGDGSAAVQIIGLHPATQHYAVDSCIVRAGQEAVVYLKTPDPELGIDTRVYISIGKTFTLGHYTGKLKIDRVYDGELKTAANPPFSEGERPQDYHNYSYGWRGLRITAPTPKLKGVERLDFAIEQFISTPEGTARHGLSAPPILVCGPDITIVEK